MASAVLATLPVTALPAKAACPQELAVYAEPEADMAIEFLPQADPAAATSHAFRLLTGKGPVLDGHVVWQGDPPRPDAYALNKCPEGDVTGEELAACTIWQGVIYAIDEAGNVGPLPPEGADAARTLLLPDFARWVRASAIWGDGKVDAAPWDVFTLSGCQE